MKKFKPKSYIPHKKLIFAWTDKKRYLIQYRVLKFHVRRGMVVETVHQIIPFKQ